MRFVSASLAVLTALAFASCRTTYRAYEGEALPETQVAIVRVQGEGSVIGALAQPLGGPHIVKILGVDGDETQGNHRNDFLPGTYTLRVHAEGSGIERTGYFETTQDITVELEAGVTYWIEPRYSEHQPPWSLNLTTEPGGEALVTTEPVRAELELLPFPNPAEPWNEVAWTKTRDRDEALYVPDGDTAENWRRRVTLQSDVWRVATTASRLREVFMKKIADAGGTATADILASDAWVVRWTKPAPAAAVEAAARRKPRRISEGASTATHQGITYFRGTEDRLYQATFETHHGPTADADCTEWEQRFLGIR